MPQEMSRMQAWFPGFCFSQTFSLGYNFCWMLGPSTSQQKMTSEKKIGRQVSGAGLMARGKISPQAKVCGGLIGIGWMMDWITRFYHRKSRLERPRRFRAVFNRKPILCDALLEMSLRKLSSGCAWFLKTILRWPLLWDRNINVINWPFEQFFVTFEAGNLSLLEVFFWVVIFDSHFHCFFMYCNHLT